MFSLISVLCEITIKLCIRHLLQKFYPKMMLLHITNWGRARGNCSISVKKDCNIVSISKCVSHIDVMRPTHDGPSLPNSAYRHPANM